MTTEDSKKDSRVHDDEIDLRELFSAIWQGKWLIMAITLVFAVGSVFYALSLPNTYKSEALLAPVSQEHGLGMSGQLGSLAALAGVNLGGSGGTDKTTLAIEVLKSREFISHFIEKYDLYVPVMAAIGWDLTSNSLLIDKSIYNEETGEWVREIRAPRQPKPSNQEAYQNFMQMMNVLRDNTTGMVRLSIEHYSPFVAKQWVDLLIKELNDEMRLRDLQEAERSIAYLNEQVLKTNLADARTMLFSLIEEQTKTLMLANVRTEYIFKMVDSPVVSEEKFRPRRSIIVVIITFLGGFLGLLVSLIFGYRKKARK